MILQSTYFKKYPTLEKNNSKLLSSKNQNIFKNVIIV